MVKYARNCYLAVKVSYFNEIHSWCKKLNINYQDVRRMMFSDPRINASHTRVPGHDGKFGYGGTCLPKDIMALERMAKDIGLKVPMISASLERNLTMDRVEQEWTEDKGRSVI
jgi:UDPglucose 6-dehydrogenase